MLDNLIDTLQDLFSNMDFQSSDFDFENIIDNLAAQGIDLTHISVEDIKAALNYALNIDEEIHHGRSYKFKWIKL
ncbi:MAG: hypothetical protein QM751_05860 [Paludibacteraceae bacterium]